MDYIKSFSEEEFCNLILQTKESLYICLPLLQPNVILTIDKLDQISHGKVSINIGLDFTPETFRQGYGEIKCYEKILTRKFNLRKMEDNRISFIITDSLGYYLFFESRYLLPADKKTLNAVKIDPISIVRLKQYFFNTYKKDELSNHIADAIISESNELKNIESDFNNSEKIITPVIDQQIIESVSKSLEFNPPLRPDYKRIVEFYTSKFQYAKLEFKGANLIHRKVELPYEVLPVMDAELKEKLETKLNLFNFKDEKKCFKPLIDYKNKIAELRDRFFIKIKSRDESLLNKEKKIEFENQHLQLERQLVKIKEAIINEIAKQINNTKMRLVVDLRDFFIANPKAFLPNLQSWQEGADYISEEAISFAQELVYNPKKIKWPKAHQLVDEFKLTIQYSDITYEDLKNKEFVEELRLTGLVSENDLKRLADFGIAVQLNE